MPSYIDKKAELHIFFAGTYKFLKILSLKSLIYIDIDIDID